MPIKLMGPSVWTQLVRSRVRSTTPQVWDKWCTRGCFFFSLSLPLFCIVPIQIPLGSFASVLTLEAWGSRWMDGLYKLGLIRHLMHATQACKVLPAQMTGYPSANHDADGLTQGSGHSAFISPPCLDKGCPLACASLFSHRRFSLDGHPARGHLCITCYAINLFSQS